MELAALIALLGGFDHALVMCVATLLTTSTMVRIVVVCIKGDKDEVKRALHREDAQKPKRNAAGKDVNNSNGTSA